MKYLTVAQVRNSPMGLPLASLSDLDIAAAIADAEGDIDSYIGFDETSGGGFETHSVTEREPWHDDTRRVYPRCAPVPVKSVTSFAIQYSQQQGTGTPEVATVDPTLIVVNNDQGYLEGVSLAVLVYGLMPALGEIAMLRPFAIYTYVAGYSLPKSNRPLVSLGDSETYCSLIPFWDSTVTPTVSVNGSVADTSTYTVNWTEGTIRFSAPQLATASVHATFNQTIPDVVTRATRLNALDRLGDQLANAAGLAGLDSLTAGKVTRKRRGTSGGTQAEPLWQTLLADLVPPHIAAAH